MRNVLEMKKDTYNMIVGPIFASRITKNWKKKQNRLVECPFEIIGFKCWLKLWKFPLKCWEGQKKWLFSWGWQKGRGFLQSGVETLHMAFKMTSKDVFPPTLNHTIISWKMKKIWFFEFLAYLRFWAYFVRILSFTVNTYKICPKT